MVSAPDPRNVVTEVFREGCIVTKLARPARISGPYQEGEPGRSIGGCRQRLSSHASPNLCTGGLWQPRMRQPQQGRPQPRLARNFGSLGPRQTGLEAGSVAHLGLPRRVSPIARPAPAYQKRRKWGGGRVLRFSDAGNATKSMVLGFIGV